jgi:hypothetical protein
MRDCRYAPAFVPHPDDRIEHRVSARPALSLMFACRVGNPGCRWPIQRANHGDIVGEGSSDLTNQPVSLFNGGEQRVRTVAQHVPAIRNLPGQRRAFASAFGVAASPITGDDFGAGVGLQPSRESVALSIGQ